MQIEIESNCPLDGFNPCRQTRCAWFTKIKGKSPQGEELDEYGCAVAWLPVLNINTAQQAAHTGAAVESFRNEMVQGQKEGIEALAIHFDRVSREPNFRTLQQVVTTQDAEVTTEED